MQIRRRGGKIEFLRSEYTKDEKRCKQKLLGSIPSHHRALSPELVEVMTEAEKAQVEEFFKAAVEQTEKWARIGAVRRSPEALNLLAEGLKTETIDKDLAQQIYEALSRVEKALKKQGFKKSSTKKPAAVKK